MSLNFGAANSHVDFGIGNAANLGSGAFTLLVLWKPAGNTGLLTGYSGTTERQGYLLDTGHVFGTGDFSSGFGSITNGDWYWIGLSKPAGAAHYRGHLRDYTTSGAWSHGEAVGAGNHSDPGTSDSLRVGADTDTTSALGDVAVAAVFTSELADATIEAACTAALSDLIAASPDWAAKFVQASPNNIADLIGSGNETGRTGTITASADPPGFDFSVSATVTGTGAGPLGALTGAATGLVTVLGTGAGALGLLVGSGRIVSGARPRVVSVSTAVRATSGAATSRVVSVSDGRRAQ